MLQRAQIPVLTRVINLNHILHSSKINKTGANVCFKKMDTLYIGGNLYKVCPFF